MRIFPAIAVSIVMVLMASGQTTTTAASSDKPAKTSVKKRARKPFIKPVAAKKPAPTKTKKPASRRSSTPRSSVSAATRAEAHEGVVEKVSRGAQLPVENAAALVPFFEQLYRQQHGELTGPLRALHYGDSHVAADEWTGDIRERLQQTFGDGGSGYSLAGRPWNSYRRLDVKSGSTRGWHSDGLVGRTGDGIYGLGGVSMTASSPRQSVYLVAEGQQFELYYLQQPGGGAIQIYDNGAPVERISTDGESAPSYFHYDAEPGPHRLEAETLDRAPVRLFGWVAEKPTGVTYEALGINGASASMMLNWNEEVLKSNIERRNPALIVLSYGTNEAGRKDWTLESYRDMFTRLLDRLRADAPTATILVVGPPDRAIRVRGKGWVTLDNVDMIVEAEREAALAKGCAFWDQRAKMGGKGSMREWVLAGMAQGDYVHLTAPGYHMIGDAMFRDLMSEYDLFVKAREALALAPNPDRP
jgi:lysophospholipase L1-like esterase